MMRAFSFQSDLKYTEAIKVLEAGQTTLGEWFERDSYWWPELLSCRSHRGMSMSLYFFEDENVLQLKWTGPDATPAGVDFALNELLTALRARNIKPTGGVN